LPSEFHTTALLYLNDTDGDTYFYKENGDIDFQVSPKANKVIIFDGDMVHSSSTPTQTQYRIALNFNFAGKPNFCQNHGNTIQGAIWL
jgi:ectoine hydroxylase-related dioxygenase (phytanoyl-CoA dioxygenase family)